MKKKKLTIVHIALIILISIILITWFKSDELASYWQQEQGTAEPFESLSESGIGKVGNAVDSFNSEKEINAELKRLNEEINKIANILTAGDALKASELAEIKKTQARIESKINLLNAKQQLVVAKQGKGEVVNTVADADNNTALPQVNSDTAQANNNTNTDANLVAQANMLNPILAKQANMSMGGSTGSRIAMTTDKKALFIGDSLMQGVAPWVMRKLQNDFQVKSINLSKHSTGLTVSKFFDWPATLEKALQDNPDVGALFVFLGGNDGQSIIDPDTNHYVRFGTERWDEVYTGRIRRVLDTAKANNVQVLWIAPPEMKKADLNKRTVHLIELYKRIPKGDAIVLTSKEILQSDTANDGYSDTMLVNGKLKKTRTADGVHFTTTGQKVIANAIMDKINIDGQPMLSTAEAY
ncbi:MAG: DUF459 domain-containing protein [Moraxellaceae bacterium]|nr:DUF459 domain-containing protein [Moraxellaceae bacterium]